MSDTPTNDTSKPLAAIPKVEPKVIEVKPSTAVETTTASSTTNEASKKIVPSKSKGFSNPALRAMGIPTLRLPSRNWSIFWIVVGVSLGGVVYDKHEQNKIRTKWCDRVAKYGETAVNFNEKARKITVYVAPPPNSYLSDSMSVFKKYIKPVLNSAGVDFEIKSENRQGVIRSTVAAEIRALRREIINTEQELQRVQKSNTWYERSKGNLLSYFKKTDKEAREKELYEKLKSDLKDLKNIIGIYYKNQDLKDAQNISLDSKISEPSLNGGIICLGRGAYKEYLHGLHEGLLGPLEKPLDSEKLEELSDKPQTVDVDVKLPTVQSIDSIQNTSSAGSTKEVQSMQEPSKEESTIGTKIETENDFITEVEKKEEKEEAKKEEAKKEEKQEDADENGEKLLPIPKPFISPEDYKSAKFAPEFSKYLQNGIKVPTQDNVAPIFQQPILVFPVYNVVGFTQIPKNIYRYYTKRYLMEEYGKATVALVENLKSNFKIEDVDLCKVEENDWPSKWIEKGKKNNSEWVQDLITDERVLSKLWVYDADRVKWSTRCAGEFDK